MSDPTANADLSPELELAERQRREYGTFRATQRINIGGALAFKQGDPVPASHVERGVVTEEQVELVPEDDAGGSAVAHEPEDDTAAGAPQADDYDDLEV